MSDLEYDIVAESLVRASEQGIELPPQFNHSIYKEVAERFDVPLYVVVRSLLKQSNMADSVLHQEETKEDSVGAGESLAEIFKRLFGDGY